VALYRAVRAAALRASRVRCATAAGPVWLAKPVGLLALLAVVLAGGARVLAPVPLVAAVVFRVGFGALLWGSCRLDRARS
jgi:hypothetical protein